MLSSFQSIPPRKLFLLVDYDILHIVRLTYYLIQNTSLEKGSGAKMKPSGIGGMAVMEGVMMKNKDIYAVAVRKPDNEITIEVSNHKDFSDKVKLFKLPIFRGMLAFVDSLVVGMKVLNYSASFFDDEDEDAQAKSKKQKQEVKKIDDDFIVEEVTLPGGGQDELASTEAETGKRSDKSNALLMALAVLISIIMSVALFMVLPVLITNLFSRFIENRYVVLFIEGIIRLAIFVGYVLLASRMNEIKRVFMYHGAEHKTINCLENGFELTVENVRWQSKQHKRCGTSFMLLVILISLVFFMFMPVNNLILKILSRILLVPFIAGVSYEFIRLAGKSESRFVQILSQPGLWMQGLTTKEPDDSMIEVAIQSVSAVFDWKQFLKSSADGASKGKASKASISKQTPAKGNNQKQAVEKQTAAKPVVDKNIQTKNTTTNSKSVTKNSETKTRPEVKPRVGGLAYTGTVSVEKEDAIVSRQEVTKPLTEAVVEKHQEERHNNIGRNKGMAPVTLKPNLKAKEDEEDDEILKALDKFFDDKKI